MAQQKLDMGVLGFNVVMLKSAWTDFNLKGDIFLSYQLLYVIPFLYKPISYKFCKNV